MNITVVHLMDLVAYPPVLSLLQNLLKNGHHVFLISYGIDKAPKEIIQHNNIEIFEVPISNRTGIVGKILREKTRRSYTTKKVKELMKKSDILWTTTDISVRCLGDVLFDYKHIMQLMELEEWYPYIVGLPFPRFSLKKYAQAAWKTVVPEINRGYIQKTWWELEKTPYILPNKPYSLEYDDSDLEEIIQRIKSDPRKKIIYLGNISSDRSLEEFAKGIYSLGNDYSLYVAGKVDDSEKGSFEKIRKTYNNVEYLGYFKAPKHLSILKYMYIGLLPYYPNSRHPFISPLNIQYCAPNKIFEYSAFGIPMIGTDVMGLREPFERYNIGKVCSVLDSDHIKQAVLEIESEYTEMKHNCKEYYSSINLDELVDHILKD